MSSGEHESPVAIYGALAANACIAVTKFIVAAMSGSSALLSEAIHSTVDTGNELLLLLGVRRSREPPTEKHPYGHGKEIYFWGLVVAMVIFAGGGAVAIYEGIIRVGAGGGGGRHFGAKLGVLGVAFVFELGSFLVAVRAIERAEGESRWRALLRNRNPAVYTVVAEDAAALLGLVVAASGVTLAHVLERPWIDAAASIVIGAILCAVAVLLARQSRTLLIGQAASKEVIEDVRKIACETGRVARVPSVLTMQLGPKDIMMNLEIALRRDDDLEGIGGWLERLEERVREAHPEITRVFIEVRRSEA